MSITAPDPQRTSTAAAAGALVSFLLAFFALPVPSPGQVPPRAEVREKLKRAWEGIGTFSFHVEEKPADESWKVLRDEEWRSADFVMDTDGRLSMQEWTNGPAGIV